MPESNVVSGARNGAKDDLSDSALGTLSVPKDVRVTFEPKFPVDPTRAENYVRHANTTRSADLALQYWFFAHRSDPTSLTILNGLLEKGAEIGNNPANVKGVLRSCQGAIQAEKHIGNSYLLSLLKYSLSPLDGRLAVDAAAEAKELNLEQATLFLGERANKLLSKSEDKNRKALFVKLAELFKHFESFQNAVNAAKLAQALDPRSDELRELIKNLSSLEYLHRSRIQQNVEVEGGFVKNIQDPEEARRLHEANQSVHSDDALFRQVEEARQKASVAPNDVKLISELAKALLQRGKEGDHKEALKVLRDGFTNTQEWSLCFEADDLEFSRAERRLTVLRNQLEENPESEEIRKQHTELSKKLITRKIESYKARIVKQSSGASKEFELGELYLEAGRYEEAIDTFQGILGDGRLGLKALAKVGFGFLNLARYDEAIFAFEETIAKFQDDEKSPYNDDGRDIFLSSHFGYSMALLGRAEEMGDLEIARQALREVSRVMVLDLDYEGGKELREKIKAFLKS